MNVDARRAGLIAALVPLAAVVAGASVVELIPRAIVSGLLVFVGLAFIVEWIWDKRRILARLEYLVVFVILAVIIAAGYLAGIVVGLVLALGVVRVQLRASGPGAPGLVRRHVPQQRRPSARGASGAPKTERPRPDPAPERVRLLRLDGAVARADPGQAGVHRTQVRGDRSGARDRHGRLGRRRLRQGEAPLGSHGSELVLTGASEPVRTQLARGGVTEQEGSLRFEPDLDRGLERCEDRVLDEEAPAADEEAPKGGGGVPSGLAPYLERVAVSEGAVVLRQEEPPGDIYVLAEGRLAVETVTPEGRRMRLRSLRPGVVVGELAFYTGAPRTADVVAETSCVILRCSREQIARIEADDPVAAIVLHRWFAETLAGRLSETMQTTATLLD